MNVGFSGTQKGMRRWQSEGVKEFIRLLKPTYGHHGDCIGADDQFDAICHFNGVLTVIHPPEDPKKRAFCEGYADILEPKPYIERNHDIVDAVDLMIFTPFELREVLRSGTWATWRYACKVKKPWIIFSPIGAKMMSDDFLFKSLGLEG